MASGNLQLHCGECIYQVTSSGMTKGKKGLALQTILETPWGILKYVKEVEKRVEERRKQESSLI